MTRFSIRTLGILNAALCLFLSLNVIHGEQNIQSTSMMTDVLSRPDGGFIEANNGNDHRAGTINLNIKNHAQVRIRVHLIVIPRCEFKF